MEREIKQTAEAYDKIGEWYHKHRGKGKNFFNSYVEMPTTLSFLKNVKGKKVLDIGCGSGIYAKILKRRGAKVTGVDISKTLLRIAEKEVKGVDFHYASIHKLPFKKNSFDIALSALMLNYVGNWDKAFKEVNRVLKKGGVYVFSIANPLFSVRERTNINNKEFWLLGYSSEGQKLEIYGDYFKEGWKTWEMAETKMLFHRKTMETIINTILKNGFSIEGYKDTKPVSLGRKVDPRSFKIFSRLPIFSVFKIKKMK